MGYIEKTYVRRFDAAGIQCEPLYPVAKWNCHQAVIQQAPRTNNAMEGWHFEFNQKFPKAKMNLSFFILKLREDEQTTWQMATRHAANPADPVRNPRPKAIVKREEQILKLVTDWNGDRPWILSFVNAFSSFATFRRIWPSCTLQCQMMKQKWCSMCQYKILLSSHKILMTGI
uniref:Transposase n=1 Tax=Ditylenchus dipsaci TaxID=166011 RepID=A0A915CNQ0_9BILA